MKKKILIIEDDIILGDVLSEFFMLKDFEVAWARNGESALRLFQANTPDIILADVILPDINGFEIVKKIKEQNSQIPVFFMTGSEIASEKQIKGFNLGAVNYIIKPFNPEVLFAQVENLMKKNRFVTYSLNKMQILIDNQIVNINNQTVKLKEKEVQMFALLLEKHGCCIKREELMMSLWKSNEARLQTSLDTYLSGLRKALKPFPRIQITTIYGCGVKLNITT